VNNLAASCTMELNQILDEYFLENRHKLLEIAAFLDRLDRACDGAAAPEDDFRVAAMRRAIDVLLSNSVRRARDIQLILSDPTDEPRERLDRKAAWGAYASPNGH
jgi:hypothetical protein